MRLRRKRFREPGGWIFRVQVFRISGALERQHRFRPGLDITAIIRRIILVAGAYDAHNRKVSAAFEAREKQETANAF
jgi:hypothetical protein